MKKIQFSFKWVVKMFTFFGLNFFDNTKFRAHRLGGIIFLLTYITAILMYIYDYDNFVEYNVPMIPSFMGVFQAVSATLTFTFLPKNQNSGYFGDKGVISYNFIKENIFYQIITFLGGWYYLYHGKITNFWMEYIELIFVFFPYTILRPLFPTTRFSDTQKDNTRYRSEGNLSFYEYGTKFISYFYLYGKHIMGFGLMYLLYKQRITEDDMKNWGWALYLLNTGTVSISTCPFSCLLY